MLSINSLPKTERYFRPRCDINNDKLDHITLSIIKNYDKIIYDEFFQSQNSEGPILINFRGNYSSKNRISIKDTINLEILKDKIVLIGLYENGNNGKPIYNEDTHWVPTNKNYFGSNTKIRASEVFVALCVNN